MHKRTLALSNRKYLAVKSVYLRFMVNEG